jgi:hypothetical protein
MTLAALFDIYVEICVFFDIIGIRALGKFKLALGVRDAFFP